MTKIRYQLPTNLYRGPDDVVACHTEDEAQAAIAQGYIDTPVVLRRRRSRAPSTVVEPLTEDEELDDTATEDEEG